ncbi:ribonuclease E/G [Acetobacter garciniae]|nr:ribonuclease E/G [Acetobacter garciniae]
MASSPGELRLAVTEQDTLVDFALWRPGAPDHVGDLYRARITALVPGMGGAFVDLGGEPGLEAGGFLPVSKDTPPLTEGQNVNVRITRAAQGGKGVRVSLVPDARIHDDTGTVAEASTAAGNPAPHGGPGLLHSGPTPLERLAARWPTARIVADSLAASARIPQHLRGRRMQGLASLPEEIAADCAALEDAEVALPGGMRATITPTPALIAIDMDAPPAHGAQIKQTAQFAANRDALPALMRQIRLRNLCGAILIDPAGLATRKRQALLEPVAASLATDPLRPRCLGVTALGLIEIVRARIHPSLPELLGSPHGHALRALRQIVTHDPTATTLRAGSRLIRALEQDHQAMADCVRDLGHPLALRLDPALPDLHWTAERS